ncbi:asparagine synthase-related protein [Paenibacillus sp. KS-LC4]|uniref:asparagine synthase-related protein n=1 Tax=Paenibacillus sp. KS-LC4 TaxID=2979727 RepID=UPI0030CEF098
MSAIAAIYQKDSEAPVSIEAGLRLMQALQKYPADAVDTWHDGRVFLGCHAQWITPESVGQLQPFHAADLRLTITADAMIDNRPFLFEQLHIDRERRASMPDSELIMLAYAKWGEEAPRYLIGDYAFIIWDQRKSELFGATDLFGSRTLYIHSDARQSSFCTTITPLLAAHHVEKKLNESWLADYLAVAIVHESSDLFATPYEHIRQVPPGHAFRIKDGKLDFWQHSKVESPEQLRLKRREEYTEAFQEIFQEAVNARMRTFRKVGATLSGGLDSGSVVSFAAKSLQRQQKQLHTFSYVPEPNFQDWTSRRHVADERPFIKKTVEFVGNIADQYLDLQGKSPLSEADEWLEMLEIPFKFVENSFWIKGVYEQSKQQGMGILLTGAMGNHSISWGPAIDYYSLLLKRLQWLRLYREVTLFGKRKAVGRKRLMYYVGKNAYPRLFPRDQEHGQQEMPLMINPAFAKRMNVFARLKERQAGAGSVFEKDAIKAQPGPFQDMAMTNMSGTQRTKLSLSYALWERDPTSDPRVVKFCLSVPIEQYVHDGYDRALIRDSTANYLPDQIRLNQRVRGIQAADWVHRMTPAWSVFVEELKQYCDDSYVAQFFNVEQMKASLAQVGLVPKPEYAIDLNSRYLLHCLVACRFVRQFNLKGGE